MTEQAYLRSVDADAEPPEDLSAELTALWLAQNDRWHESHDIAQDIDTPMGSWIHAHLHLIEGDVSNAAYWYRRAARPVGVIEDRQDEWRKIVAEAFRDC